MRKMIMNLTIWGLLLFWGITVCGKGKSFDASDFTRGFQVVDMLDEDAYQQDGKKMVETLSEFFENLDNTDNACMVERKKKLFGDAYYKKTVDSEDADYIYFGKLKDEKPDGWGVLLDKDGTPFYVGDFKKGKIKGYGMVLAGSADYILAVAYEGEISTIEADGDVVPADGNAVIPYDYVSITNAYQYEMGSSGEEIRSGEGAWVLKCTPKYIGGVKDGKYSGDGTLYDVYGNVVYEGEFKKGQYSGKGTLYYEDGSMQYTGKFKNGMFNGKGVLYERDGSVRHDGEFKNGDVK